MAALKVGFVGALAVCAPFPLITGCSSDTDSGSTPPDGVVYDASAETTQATGITTWGYSTDAAGATIFHGYNPRTELLIEIRQTFDATDVFTKRYALEVTGPLGSGQVLVDYVAVWNKEANSTTFAPRIGENTIVKGSGAARALERLAPDAAHIPINAAVAHAGGGSLIQSSTHPLEDPKPLVGGQSKLVVCCCELMNGSAGTAAAAASSCALVTSNADLVATNAGSARPQGLGGIHLDALGIGPDKSPQVQSPWNGDYNVVDHQCHHAAAQNVSSTDGYVSCDHDGWTNPYGGHTVNWAPDPTQPGKKGSYCLYDPQAPGATLLTHPNDVCCWQGGAIGLGGTPMFNTAEALDCAVKVCRQGNVQPSAFPPGQEPPLPIDCPATTSSEWECQQRWASQLFKVAQLFSRVSYPEDGPQFDDYARRMSALCAAKPAGAVAPAASHCLPNALASNAARDEAKATCPNI
jgi:hypothetical protein